MSDYYEQLLSAHKEDLFLDKAYSLVRENYDDRKSIAESAAKLHNDNALNLANEFLLLTSDSGIDFFQTRHVFEDALPLCNMATNEAIECVLHLTKEAGNDMAAGWCIPPFISYCTNESSRALEAMELILNNNAEWLDLLSPVLVSGSNVEPKAFSQKAIELTQKSNIEIKVQAIHALGRMELSNESIDEVLSALKAVVENDYNDQCYSEVLWSAYSLLKADNSQEANVSEVINLSLGGLGEQTLHAASRLFMFEKNTIPIDILENLFVAFKSIPAKNTATFDQLDHGLVSLLDEENYESPFKLIETLIVSSGGDVKVTFFDSFARDLFNKKDLLNKLITRWFLSGETWLERACYELIKNASEKGVELQVDASLLTHEHPDIHVYLAKKACGWFYLKPVSAVSFIVSLIDHAKDEHLPFFQELLFHPLLVSYSGQAKDYLTSIENTASAKVNNIISLSLEKLDHYHQGLQDAMAINELSPSIADRQAYQRKSSQEMTEIYKEANKNSLMSQIMGSPSVILYGMSSIHYVYGADDQKTRQVVPMQSFSTSVEYPSLSFLDPHGIDSVLRAYKLEEKCV